MQAADLTYTTTETGYTILLDGKPWVVQDGFIPYKGSTMAESAQNHIDQILADQIAAEKAAKQPTVEQRLSAAEAAILALGKGSAT